MTNEDLLKKLKSLISGALDRQNSQYAKEMQSSLKLLRSSFDGLAKKADAILGALKRIQATQKDHERRLRLLEQAQSTSRSNSLSRFL